MIKVQILSIIEHGQGVPLRNARYEINPKTLYPARQQQNYDDYQ